MEVARVDAVMVNQSDLSVIFDFFYKLATEQIVGQAEGTPTGSEHRFEPDFINFVAEDYDNNQPDTIFCRKLQQDSNI